MKTVWTFQLTFDENTLSFFSLAFVWATFSQIWAIFSLPENGPLCDGGFSHELSHRWSAGFLAAEKHQRSKKILKWGLYYKLFYGRSLQISVKNRVFILGKPFQLCRMFVGKARGLA
jgi:hypothetical protein